MAGDNRMRDPYAILGISRTADQLEIKAAWRNVAKKLHPDQNRNDPQAQSRFTEAGRAYDLLKDPEKRRRYDELLRSDDVRIAVDDFQTILKEIRSSLGKR